MDDTKPLPSVPPSEAPLPNPHTPPPKAMLRPDTWHRLGNANTDPSSPLSFGQSIVADRDLPKIPDAPSPPPHGSLSGRYLTSADAQNTGFGAAAQNTSLQQNGRRPPIPDANSASTNRLEAPRPILALPPILDLVLSDPSRLGGTATPDTDNNSTSDVARIAPSLDNRHSRDTTISASTGHPHLSAESSAATSASSVSGPNEKPGSADGSPESSLVDGLPGNRSAPALQYHHQAFLPQSASTSAIVQQTPMGDFRSSSNPDLSNPAAIDRNYTPTSYSVRRSSIPRPRSAYSVYSDLGPRGRSPGFIVGSHMRASSNSRMSPETRPSSYADMLNVPYPQPGPAPISLDNAQLRHNVGSNASLLSTEKTLEMYRQNVKKTNDTSIQYSFAVFLISTAQELGLNFDEPAAKRKSTPKLVRDQDSPYMDSPGTTPQELVREARSILQRLSNAGYPFAQYYLADGYASGLFSKGKEDYNAAFPLFVLAAKHGHAESAYRTALCYEFGWGCRKDPAKAVQFLRNAASKRHPGAMTRLGKACLSGDLGEKRYREGIKWLKLATESADAIYNAAPYQLGCLYETGYGDDIFQDEGYAAELFTQSAELGHPDANFRMGEAYEHGKLNCPRDPALSVHFYTGAAERGHAGAMMGLCAWYMVGAEPFLQKDEEEAYEWAHRAAELGKSKTAPHPPSPGVPMNLSQARSSRQQAN